MPEVTTHTSPESDHIIVRVKISRFEILSMADTADLGVSADIIMRETLRGVQAAMNNLIRAQTPGWNRPHDSGVYDAEGEAWEEQAQRQALTRPPAQIPEVTE